jgi:hypothetical protein
MAEAIAASPRSSTQSAATSTSVASRTGNDITLAAPLPSTVGLVGAAVRSDPGVWDAVRRVELSVA